MVYWKVKDMNSGNVCKGGIGYEGIFYINKFKSKEEAIEFIKTLPHGHGFVNPYKIFRFDDKKGDGKGWQEAPGRDGKAPIHKEVAIRAQAKHAQNTIMMPKPTEKRERHIKSLIDRYIEKGYSPGSAKIMAEIDYDNIFKSERTTLIIQNISSMPIQKESIELIGTTSVTSPQNFQPIEQLTLGDTLYFYYDKPFRVVKGRGSIEILPKDKEGHFIIGEDNMGSITLSHSQSKKEAFFQSEADTDAVKDLLTKTEKDDLESGWTVEIPDYEPRASSLQEMFEAGGGD